MWTVNSVNTTSSFTDIRKTTVLTIFLKKADAGTTGKSDEAEGRLNVDSIGRSRVGGAYDL